MEHKDTPMPFTNFECNDADIEDAIAGYVLRMAREVGEIDREPSDVEWDFPTESDVQEVETVTVDGETALSVRCEVEGSWQWSNGYFDYGTEYTTCFVEVLFFFEGLGHAEITVEAMETPERR